MNAKLTGQNRSAEFTAVPRSMKDEDFFSRSFAQAHPDIFEKHVRGPLREMKAGLRATDFHRFCGWLHERGWLRRIYTQNIDGLHHAEALVPRDKVVECHGAIDTGLF